MEAFPFLLRSLQLPCKRLMYRMVHKQIDLNRMAVDSGIVAARLSTTDVASLLVDPLQHGAIVQLMEYTIRMQALMATQ
jgi:hypothetical protein